MGQVDEVIHRLRARLSGFADDRQTRGKFADRRQIPGTRLLRLGLAVLLFPLAAAAGAAAAPFASLAPASTPAGYLARLLVNEVLFPGEHGYASEEDTRGAMLAVLWVLHSRARFVPPGYKRTEIAATDSVNIIDLVTAPNQCEGFFRGADGRPATAERVEKRIAYLLRIANSGAAPGRFARLLNHAQALATAYFDAGPADGDIYEALSRIGKLPVTGRAYAWMTGQDTYHPGGNFVRIPEADNGVLGGNRFYTLRKDPQ